MIYRLRFQLDDFLHYDTEGVQAADLFEGIAPFGRWNVRPIHVIDNPKRRRGDFAKLSPTVFAVTARALNVIRPLLPARAEVLEVRAPKGKMFAIRTLDIVPALTAAATFIRYDDGGIMGIRHYDFDDGVLAGHHLFRLPESQEDEVLVSDEFKRAVEDAGLTGARFDDPNAQPWFMP